MALGNNVRTFRHAQGESLTQTARAVGMDRTQLSRLERSIVGCSDEFKVALARHFGTTVSRLFFQENVEDNSTVRVA
jgi:transcriptional regulator with XRE-family HTH domain